MFKRINLCAFLFVLFNFIAAYSDSLPNCSKIYYNYNRFQDPVVNNQVLTIPWKGGVEVIATVKIDSIVNTKITFSVLSLSQIDTSVYSNTITTMMNNGHYVDTPYISYDTSGFPLHHTDSLFSQSITYYDTPLSVGREFKKVFILQISPYEGLRYWLISKSKDCFLDENVSSFSLRSALTDLNNFVNQNNILKGYAQPKNGVLKLGPIFNLTYSGDPTWGLTAYNDSSYWYFKQYAGYGDCPLGCTDYFYAYYKVSNDGKVKLDSSHCTLGYCLDKTGIADKPRSQMGNNTGIGSLRFYTISGRCVGKITSDRELNINYYRSKLGLNHGIYLVKNENGNGLKIIRVDKSK